VEWVHYHQPQLQPTDRHLTLAATHLQVAAAAVEVILPSMVAMVVLAAAVVGQAQLVQAEPLHHLVKVTQAAALMFPTSTAAVAAEPVAQAAQGLQQAEQAEQVQPTQSQVLQ
jgi:hypothetical protein